ncbi:MAG: hypothetical protein V4665_03490 [Patescibacteria group bacterium]
MNRHNRLTFEQKIKKNIWQGIYPVFPWMQKNLLRFHIIWHQKERQEYRLGWLAPGKTLPQLQKHLHEKWGFGNHFIAWIDTGQVLSWRKLENFDFQYHLRVFEDGEIRGHYEYTPESKPIKHFLEINEERRTEKFKEFLGEFLTEHEYRSRPVPDDTIAPPSQITIDTIIPVHS